MNRLGTMVGTAIARILTAPIDTPPALPLDMERLRLLLRPADVILVEGNLRISGAIKYLTQSTWSHAALYAGAVQGRDGIEAHVVEGVRWFGLESFAGYHLRICRPIGLSEADRRAVIAYAQARIGSLYDLRYVFDLARYLFPLPVPRRWRRRAIGFGAGDPSRAICSTLVANAFQSIGYPILPELPEVMPAMPGAGMHRMLEIHHIHRNGLFVPRDFDASPYFDIIKPDRPRRFDHHRLVWVEETPAEI